MVPIYEMRKLRLSRGNDTSKDMWLFSGQAGIGTWVFQVSNVPPASNVSPGWSQCSLGPGGWRLARRGAR